jgi:hypothetical protein
MSALDSLVYKYLLESGNTEAAEALLKNAPKVSFVVFFFKKKGSERIDGC